MYLCVVPMWILVNKYDGNNKLMEDFLEPSFHWHMILYLKKKIDLTIVLVERYTRTEIYLYFWIYDYKNLAIEK